MHVAIADDTTGEDIANVYDLSLITTGPERNGSFGGVWVGEVWRVLRARVPQG